MLKKAMLSVMGGVMFAMISFFSPEINAACNGRCPDSYDGHAFVSCATIVVGGQVVETQCNYAAAKTLGPGDEIAIEESPVN